MTEGWLGDTRRRVKQDRGVARVVKRIRIRVPDEQLVAAGVVEYVAIVRIGDSGEGRIHRAFRASCEVDLIGNGARIVTAAGEQLAVDHECIAEGGGEACHKGSGYGQIGRE